MTDDQLREYLPSYGDRLAVFGYCRRKEKEPRNHKSKVFERLKAKIVRKKADCVSESECQTSSRNARKNERKIELGWLHLREGELVQVRTKKGGGTRKLSVQKDYKKADLVEKAVELFFPGGRNAEGSRDDFDCDITDFQQNSVDDSITVGEIYENTKLPVLRFYLTTKKRENVCENSDVTAQETPDKPDNCPSDTLAANAIEGSSSDVIYVGSSTGLANMSIESVSPLLPETFLQEDTLDDSGIVTVRRESVSGMEYSSADDTLPLSQEPSFDSALSHDQSGHTGMVKKIIVVHRGQIMKELLQVFCDASVKERIICFKVMLPDGKFENAVDDGGVLRDVLSEFWSDFYEQCTVGNCFKVPFLRHDFGKQEWESVGRIITFGWQEQKYLPVKLAPVILEQAVLGNVESDLVDTFFKYVSESERLIFESCCSDFEGVDQEELLDILDVHGCRRMPTADNIKQILRELAHQKLIQEPAFVIEQWSNMLAPLRSELKGIAALYEGLQPTARKIIKSIVYPPSQNLQEKQMVKYVHAYLRDSDTQHLSSFLRFCTGSDLFIGKNITVSFTQIQGFQRRPVAHTCGCYLELPVSYDSYPDFRNEMNRVLESNVWVMDIV